MKSIFVFLFGFSLGMFTFWLFGFDFEKRGVDTGFAFVVSMIGGAFALTGYQLHKQD